MERETSIVTTKGQLVIPARLRKRLGIREGTVVVFTEENEKLVIQPITSGYIHRLRGSLKGEPAPSRLLVEERRLVKSA